MRLLAVEVNRLASRRLARLTALGVLVIIGIALFALLQTAKPIPESQLEMYRGDFDRAVQEWEDGGREQCEADEEMARETEPGVDYGCDQGPRWEDWYWEEPTFAESAPTLLPLLALPFAFAAFLVGVSFVAAEFSTGSMGNWLTFEPRRTRVYASKVAAAAVAVLPAALVACAVTVLGAWGVHSVNDHVGEMTTEVWTQVAVSGVRATLLVVGMAALGAALGTIVRSTAAAIGAVVGYVVVVEAILGSLVTGLQPYLLRLNLTAVTDGEALYYVESCTSDGGQQFCDYVEKSVSLTQGALTMSALLVVVVLVGWATFRRRDVV